MENKKLSSRNFGFGHAIVFCVIVFFLFGYLNGFEVVKLRTPFPPHPKEKSDFLEYFGIRRKFDGIEGRGVNGSTDYLVDVPLVVGGPQMSCVHGYDVLAILR